MSQNSGTVLRISKLARRGCEPNPFSLSVALGLGELGAFAVSFGTHRTACAVPLAFFSELLRRLGSLLLLSEVIERVVRVGMEQRTGAFGRSDPLGGQVMHMAALQALDNQLDA